jgi:hypothetical protein
VEPLGGIELSQAAVGHPLQVVSESSDRFPVPDLLRDRISEGLDHDIR